MLRETVKDEFIALEGLESVLMDRLPRTIHALASIAKGRNVIYPCRGREEDYRYNNDRQGQEPQSPGDAFAGRPWAQNVHPRPVDAERPVNTKSGKVFCQPARADYRDSMGDRRLLHFRS